jgi:predicted ATPase/DNA-binding SARP family transcriptional activator
VSLLNIRLFGPFEADLDGRPVVFAYGKIKAILAYLAFNLGRPVQREKLAGLIWPDQPQEIAFEDLRQALSRLRKSIGDKDVIPSYLVVDREKVKLNPEANIQVDVDLFREALAFCSRHVHRHSRTCYACASQLDTACQIFRGDFLEDLSLPESDLFEDWAAGLREQLHEQALEALGWLAIFYQLAGDYQTSLTYARRQLEMEPLNEEIFLRLLKILAGSGKVDQALAHYWRFRKKLEDEIGQAPSQAIADYIERLRSNEGKPGSGKETAASDLPVPLTPLIGRQVELNELEAWLADPSRRLITLLGPGGMGKTRLAIAAAEKHVRIFADGVIFASLSEANNAANLMLKITDAAGFPIDNEQEFKQRMLEFLNDKDLLLVLDGFEHVLDGKKVVNWLLESGPGLVILVTSRERLNVPGEWVFPMGGLPFPPPELAGDIIKYSAVELFIFMARQLDPNFALTPENQGAISQICSLVDGMPLAIGLASAWARTLPCDEIARELQNGLDLLSTSGLSPEGQPISMRAAFEQSWNRLSEEERRAFRRITIFCGGFDRQAAEAITGANLGDLASLVDKSFVRGSPEGRYELHDLLLQYGREKLAEGGEIDPVSQQHFDYFLRLAEKNEADLRLGDNPFQAFFWMVKEQANLRAAYEWASTGNPPRHEAGARQLLECMHEELHKTGTHNQKFLEVNLINKS